MFTVYTKDYCPFCTKAKMLLDNLEIPYQEVDFTDNPEKMQEIMQISGMRTVPQIFASETECLGGYDDIEKLHSEGKLLEKVEK